MKLVYRILDVTDLNQFFSLMIEGARDFPLGFLMGFEEAMEFDWGKRLETGNYRGVFSGADMVGLCALRHSALEREKHRTDLGPFFVKKEFQGKGVAQFMMDSVVEETRALGAERIELFVDKENLRAIGFYEKYGFKAECEMRDSTRIDGVPRMDVMYHYYMS